MRFVCLLPVPSLPCRYRPSAWFRRASLRACAVLLLRCGSGLLLLFGSFLFGFHCFSSLSLILGIKIPPFLRAVKLLSLVLICTELHKKRLFLQSLCSSQVQLIAHGYKKTAHCCGRFIHILAFLMLLQPVP